MHFLDTLSEEKKGDAHRLPLILVFCFLCFSLAAILLLSAKNTSGDTYNPSIQKMEVPVADTHIDGFLLNLGGTSPVVLILGGGANIPYENSYKVSIQQQLAKIGLSSFAFDYRGVGKTSDILSETSLNTRLEDSKTALEKVRSIVGNRPVYVFGMSMGGHIAIKLSAEVQLTGLILVDPTAYPENAELVSLGTAFENIQGAKTEWVQSPDFDTLENFKGHVLVVFGSEDTFVPVEVQEKYKATVSEHGVFVSLQGASHSFLRNGDEKSGPAQSELYANIQKFVPR